MQSNVKKNLTYQIAYRILTVFTPLITSPYLSRVLGAEALGKYSASYSYVNYFMLFAMLGIEKYGNRSIARVQQNRNALEKEFWSIYAVQLTASVISILGYLAFVSFVVSDHLKVVYFLQGLWVISSLLDINWFYFGCELFRVTVLRSSIIKIISVISILLFVKSPDHLWVYILIMSGSMVLSQLVLWASLYKIISIRKPDFSSCRRHIAPIFKLFLPVLAISVFHIMDKTMLNILSNDANSGYYYNADKLVNIPLGIITAISTVLLPKMANTMQTKGSEAVIALLKKSSELSMFLTCAIAFGIGSIAKTFVPIFFGPGYETCISLIHWFIPVLIVKAFSNFSREQYLIPKGRDNLYILAVVSGAISNLIANIVLIRKYAALGAVLGTLIAEIVVLVVQIIGVRKEVDFVRLFVAHAYYIFCALVMLTVVVSVEQYVDLNQYLLLVLEILIGGLSFLILSIFYWILNKNSIFHGYCMRLFKV